MTILPGCIAAAVLLALVTAGQCCNEEGVDVKSLKSEKVSTPPKEAHGLTPEEATHRVSEAVRKELGEGFSFRLTPPFPLVWPPGGDPRVVYFAYAQESLPTGTIRYRVYSPSARVEVRVGGGSDRDLRLQRLNSRPLPGSEARQTWEEAPEQMVKAQQALFEAVAASRKASPADEQWKSIRSAYHDWIERHPSVVREIRKELPRFFAWLEADKKQPTSKRK